MPDKILSQIRQPESQNPLIVMIFFIEKRIEFFILKETKALGYKGGKNKKGKTFVFPFRIKMN